MTFELDHVFIITQPGASEADRLVANGLQEGSRKTHPGQGTANRRFFFSNGMLELLWIADRSEAAQGPGAGLGLLERSERVDACPFGLVFRAVGPHSGECPFEGWCYAPSYLASPNHFHIGANSDRLDEPLLVFAPFSMASTNPVFGSPNGEIVEVVVAIPEQRPSVELTQASMARGLRLECSAPYLMQVSYRNASTEAIDLRPDLPLVLHR